MPPRCPTDYFLIWPSPYTLAFPCFSWLPPVSPCFSWMPPVSVSDPVRPLLHSHSRLSVFVQTPQHGLMCRFFPAVSSHTLTWDFRHSSTNLREATLFHSFKPLLPLPTLLPTHLLTFWQTPVLPSPDVVISCEVFCSPSPPPSLVSALCSMMMLTTLAGSYFCLALFLKQ